MRLIPVQRAGCGMGKPSVSVCENVPWQFVGALVHPPFLRCLIDRFNYVAQHASNAKVKFVSVGRSSFGYFHRTLYKRNGHSSFIRKFRRPSTSYTCRIAAAVKNTRISYILLFIWYKKRANNQFCRTDANRCMALAKIDDNLFAKYFERRFKGP